MKKILCVLLLMIVFCNISFAKNAVKKVSVQDPFVAVLMEDGSVAAGGINKDGRCDVENWTNIADIETAQWHTVGLKDDGTVVACGYNGDGRCNVNGWTDIVAIAAGKWHTVGLKSDGTVIACGDNTYGQCNVEDWKNIKTIYAKYGITVGIQKDGTVVACGGGNGYDYKELKEKIYSSLNEDIKKWKGKKFVSLKIGEGYIVGLKADGIVDIVGLDDDGRYITKKWKDIKAIDAGTFTVIGLKKDGTVVFAGSHEYSGVSSSELAEAYEWKERALEIKQDVKAREEFKIKPDDDARTVIEKMILSQEDFNEVKNWKNIKSVYLIDDTKVNEYIIGLKGDGTVVCSAEYWWCYSDIIKWTDIKEIYITFYTAIGIKNDGTIITVNDRDGNFKSFIEKLNEEITGE